MNRIRRALQFNEPQVYNCAMFSLLFAAAAWPGTWLDVIGAATSIWVVVFCINLLLHSAPEETR